MITALPGRRDEGEVSEIALRRVFVKFPARAAVLNASKQPARQRNSALTTQVAQKTQQTQRVGLPSSHQQVPGHAFQRELGANRQATVRILWQHERTHGPISLSDYAR